MKNVAVYGLIFVSLVLLPLHNFAQEAAKPAPAKPVAPQKTTIRPFRTGTAISAQISYVKLPVTGLSPYAPPSTVAPSDMAYAVVTTKLDKDRSLSIYDYELADGLASYPCWAISQNGGNFDAGKWEYPQTGTGETYALLFIVKKPRDFKKFITYKLQSRIVQENGVDILFFNWADKPMQAIKAIPAAGNIGIDLTPPPPPKPKTPPPAKPAAKDAKAKDAKTDPKAKADPKAKDAKAADPKAKDAKTDSKDAAKTPAKPADKKTDKK